MMSGHGANPMFFDKKNKIERPENLLSPQPLRPITSHFCLTHPTHPQSVRHMCITPYCYKMHTSVIESTAPLYIETPLYMAYSLSFLQENIDHSIPRFFKISVHHKKGAGRGRGRGEEGSHYEEKASFTFSVLYLNNVRSLNQNFKSALKNS